MSVYEMSRLLQCINGFLFGAMAVLYFFDAKKTSRMMETFAEEHESIGWIMRYQFYNALFVANLARFFSSVCDLALGGTTSGFLLWVSSIVHWTPTLIFLTAYALLVLFWAQIYYAFIGSASSLWLKRNFIIINFIVYVSFFLVTVVALTEADSSALPKVVTFWHLCDFLVGSLYLLGTSVLLFYGVRVSLLFRVSSSPSGGDSGYGFDFERRHTVEGRGARRLIFWRITGLCCLCSAVLLLQVLYHLGSGLDLIEGSNTDNAYHNAGDVSVGYLLRRQATEALLILLTEFVPSAVCWAVLRSKSMKSDFHASSPGMLGNNKHYSGYSTPYSTGRMSYSDPYQQFEDFSSGSGSNSNSKSSLSNSS